MGNEKTLYVSDLDGTLLNENDGLSDFTLRTINSLLGRGMRFTYATARSLSSAGMVTRGLAIQAPVAVYNGTFIRDPKTGDEIASASFSADERRQIVDFLRVSGIHHLIYAFLDGSERVSYTKGKVNEGMRRYLDLRRGDRRMREVASDDELYGGDIFYVTCIGTREELAPVYTRFHGDPGYTCTIQQELYREEYWCEIMPRFATKAHAVRRLKELLGCERVVVFGDAVNDIPMFRAADESYAVENAVEELKACATALIPSNDSDGVAKFLLERYAG